MLGDIQELSTRDEVRVQGFALLLRFCLITYMFAFSLRRPNYQRSTVGRKRGWRSLYYQTLCLIILFSERLSLPQPHTSGPCQSSGWSPPRRRATDFFTHDEAVTAYWGSEGFVWLNHPVDDQRDFITITNAQHVVFEKWPNNWLIAHFNLFHWPYKRQMSNNDPLCPIMSVLYKCWTFYVCHLSTVCVVKTPHFSPRYSCASYPNTTNVYLTLKGPVGKSVPWVLTTEESLLALNAAYSCFDLFASKLLLLFLKVRLHSNLTLNQKTIAEFYCDGFLFSFFIQRDKCKV